MLQLYHQNISVCAQKVRVVLDEKQLGWEGILVDLKAGEQTSPEYVKLNPRGVVPTLIHDGQVVIESTIICEYLDEVFPDTPLRPADPVERARMRWWAKIPDDGIHVACGSLSYAAAFGAQLAKGFTDDELAARLERMPDKARAARQRQILAQGYGAPLVRDSILLHNKMLTEMSGRLADNDWLAGGLYTIGDICLLPYVERLHRLGLAPMWDDKPGVAAWFDRVRARPSYASAITAYPPNDDYDDLLIERGESAWPDVKRVLDQL